MILGWQSSLSPSDSDVYRQQLRLLRLIPAVFGARKPLGGLRPLRGALVIRWVVLAVVIDRQLSPVRKGFVMGVADLSFSGRRTMSSDCRGRFGGSRSDLSGSKGSCGRRGLIHRQIDHPAHLVVSSLSLSSPVSERRHTLGHCPFFIAQQTEQILTRYRDQPNDYRRQASRYQVVWTKSKKSKPQR